MPNQKVQILKSVIEFQHQLTVWYASLLKDTDHNKCFEVEGKKINSLYWIVAHLANSENVLLAQALGKKGSELEWLKKYKLGSSKEISNEVPYKEVVETAKEIHINCMKILDELTDEDLKKDNSLGFSFNGDTSILSILKHHIRHQGVHTGHLSILCKLNGIKTV